MRINIIVKNHKGKEIDQLVAEFSGELLISDLLDELQEEGVLDSGEYDVYRLYDKTIDISSNIIPDMVTIVIQEKPKRKLTFLSGR